MHTNVVGVGTLSHYHSLAQVGEGMYGFVYRAKTPEGEQVALKRLVIHKEHQGFPLCAVREIKFLKALRHKNLVQLRDIITSKGCEYLDIVLDHNSKALVEQSKSSTRLADMVKAEQTVGGEDGEVDVRNENATLSTGLQEAVQQQEERNHSARVLSQCGSLYLVFDYVDHDLGGLIDSRYQFPPRALKCVMKQIFEALAFLAENRVIHRDIKTSNILISTHHHIKLADFGLARSAALSDGREGKEDLTNNVVTMWYKSPELLLGSTTYNYAVDVWSAGCVMAELALARPLFPGKSEIEQLDMIFRTLGSPSEADWPGLADLPHVDKMLRHAPKFKSSFRDSVGKEMEHTTVSLLDRIFIMDPSSRCSARMALSSRYFMAQPTAPEDPAELPPLNVAVGTSLHEFETKRRRKNKESEDVVRRSGPA